MPKSKLFMPEIIKVIVQLHKENPDKHFLSPSISNYTLLQYERDAFPAHFGYWENQCKTFIDGAGEVLLIPTSHWYESEGVIAELLYARATGKRIRVDKYREKYHLDVWNFANQVVETLNV